MEVTKPSSRGLAPNPIMVFGSGLGRRSAVVLGSLNSSSSKCLLADAMGNGISNDFGTYAIYMAVHVIGMGTRVMDMGTRVIEMGTKSLNGNQNIEICH